MSEAALEIPKSSSLRAELRASHAGETGAVWIYRGILAVNYLRKDAEIEVFANEHLSTEKIHKNAFENLIHHFRGSFLLLLWTIAGFITGFIAACGGREWIFYTIYRVETFVDKHYKEQVQALLAESPTVDDEFINLLKNCNEDEIDHRDEALSLMDAEPTKAMLVWGDLVDYGSRLAVKIARVV